MGEEYLDGNGNPITEGFYKNPISGTIVYLENEDGWKIEDANGKNTLKLPGDHKRILLVHLTEPLKHLNFLRKNADFIESKLEQMAKSKAEHPA